MSVRVFILGTQAGVPMSPFFIFSMCWCSGAFLPDACQR